jgi:hypothetical protein
MHTWIVWWSQTNDENTSNQSDNGEHEKTKDSQCRKWYWKVKTEQEKGNLWLSIKHKRHTEVSYTSSL